MYDENELIVRALIKGNAAAWLDGWNRRNVDENSTPADNYFLKMLDALDEREKVENDKAPA
jgi:hypothetical protein